MDQSTYRDQGFFVNGTTTTSSQQGRGSSTIASLGRGCYSYDGNVNVNVNGNATPSLRVPSVTPWQDSHSTFENSERGGESTHHPFFDPRPQQDHDTAEFEGAPPMEDGAVCMTVVRDNTTLALACYDQNRNEILLETIPLSTSIVAAAAAAASSKGAQDASLATALERFLETARPTLVLVSSKLVTSHIDLLNLVTKAPAPLEEDDHPESLVDKNTLPNGRDSEQRSTTGTATATNTATIPYQLLKTKAFDLQLSMGLILRKLQVSSLMTPDAMESHSRQYHHSHYRDDSSERHFAASSAAQDPAESRTVSPSTYHALASIVDFDCKVQVQALGALLYHLQTSLLGGDVIRVHRLHQARSSSHLYLAPSTFAALHIFATEHHPLLAQGAGRSKEGFSIFSLLDRTHSKGGKQLLKDWMRKPLTNLQEIVQRQDAIELFLHQDLLGGPTAGILLSLLQQMGPMDKILARCHKSAMVVPQDILATASTLASIGSILEVLTHDVAPRVRNFRSQEDPDDPIQGSNNNSNNDNTKGLAFVQYVMEHCQMDRLGPLFEQFHQIADLDATKSNKTLVIRRGFHPTLDFVRDRLEDLPQTLLDVGASLSSQYPDLPLSIAYVPQLGFLVAIPPDFLSTPSVVSMPAEFKYTFQEGDKVYYKHPTVYDMDENIGDPDGYIKDIEALIVHEMERLILDVETELRNSFQAISHLDCILALADCAADYQFVRPKILESTANKIYIKDGRHPLQEQITVDPFVPNGTNLSDTNRVQVITGPNYSGKSCYLRQVGILVYLAHLGCFLPCAEAEISIVDQILVRISTVETCAVPQSSFQLDLTQMASILRRCTSRSLVLMDEFGKGTSPASGIALLGATLKKMARLGCKTICTTHFLELFSRKILQDGVDGIQALQMAIQIPSNKDEDAAPLFRLQEGVASSSAGLMCAKKAGVPSRILHRAQEVLESLRASRPIGRPQSSSEKQLDDECDSECDTGKPKGGVLVASKEDRDLVRYFSSVDNWKVAKEDQLRILIRKVALSMAGDEENDAG